MSIDPNKRKAGLAGRSFLLLTAALLAVAPVSGCRQKQEQQKDQAKVAVDHALQEGLGKYSPEEAAALNQKLKMAAGDEQRTHEFSMNCTENREQVLDQVRKEAERLEATLPARKEAARVQAERGLADAKKALAAAKAAALPYLSGRLKHGNPSAITQALNLVEQTLSQAERLWHEEDYLASARKAAQAKEESNTLEGQFLHSGTGNNR